MTFPATRRRPSTQGDTSPAPEIAARPSRQRPHSSARVTGPLRAARPTPRALLACVIGSVEYQDVPREIPGNSNNVTGHARACLYAADR